MVFAGLFSPLHDTVKTTLQARAYFLECASTHTHAANWLSEATLVTSDNAHACVLSNSLIQQPVLISVYNRRNKTVSIIKWMAVDTLFHTTETPIVCGTRSTSSQS